VGADVQAAMVMRGPVGVCPPCLPLRVLSGVAGMLRQESAVGGQVRAGPAHAAVVSTAVSGIHRDPALLNQLPSQE
jgi:hypothetical protein